MVVHRGAAAEPEAAAAGAERALFLQVAGFFSNLFRSGIQDLLRLCGHRSAQLFLRTQAFPPKTLERCEVSNLQAEVRGLLTEHQTRRFIRGCQQMRVHHECRDKA